MPAPTAPLPADLRTPALVLTDDPSSVAPAEGVTVCAVGERPARDGGWASVTLALADETALRRLVSALPPLGRARSLVVVLRSAVSPVALVPRPEWPALRELDVRAVDGGAVTRVELTRGLPVADVLVELARGTGSRAVAGRGSGSGGLVSAVDLGLPVDGTGVTDDVPASLVAPSELPAEPSTILTVEPVRPPAGPDLAVGPLDDTVLDLRGSDVPATRPAVDLDPGWEPTPALVASLRDVEGVRLVWPAPERLVAGLALAGVPLLPAGPVPAASREVLGAALADLLEPAAADLDREVRSVLLARAAHDLHAVPAWRARAGARAGLRTATAPTLSVVLTAPAGPGLDHARAQVERQVGVDVEVLAPGEPARGDVVLTTAADGWWGPEVLADLLRARRSSGADVVEMPAEVVHAEAIGTTVRRLLPTRTYVAGPDRSPGIEGLVLVDRALAGLGPGELRAAGATTYRTHGLAHVARLRGGHEHVGALLRSDRVRDQWRGLRLGPLVTPCLSVPGAAVPGAGAAS
ncbi:hypothetical protein GGQ22_14955 [Nocardioides sp. zg-579]|uniref:Uncharacterized protein n=1 Tax=Nocardioides marmotae TaxID=2663857 RepID=A0A6I3JDX9_9ACTN|nr:hypothetical protein [Nocardioides marmotae]MCR6032724.1 hypothetical protein [Gordonia jinghuaiqii]MTB96374.1 hypothetical protein [Nocardioides marmotae]QKE03147.1 hypothetical protein HPC71_20340 [Nocardioides marmotae]